jgi:hypothetical protein
MGSESAEVPITTEDIVVGMLLPAAIALILFVIGWRRWRDNASPARGLWTAPLAIALAIVCGVFQLKHHAFPPYPPAESFDRLFYCIPFVFAVSLLLNIRRLPIWACALAVAIVSAIAFRYVLTFKFNALPPGEAWMWTAFCAAVPLIWWLALDRYADRAPCVAPPVALFILGSAMAVIFMLSDILSDGKSALAIVAAIGSAAIAALFFADFRLGRGGVFAFVLLTLLLGGHAFVTAGLQATELALVLISPVVLWLASLIPMRSLRPWQRVLIHLLLMSIPLAIATARAAVAFNKANDFGSSSMESDL